MPMQRSKLRTGGMSSKMASLFCKEKVTSYLITMPFEKRISGPSFTYLEEVKQRFLISECFNKMRGRKNEVYEKMVVY